MQRIPADSPAAPSAPVLRERVTPPVTVWLVGAGTALLLGVSFYPLGVGVAVVIAALGLLFVSAALWLTSPVVTVSDGVLRAGRAQIDLRFTGEVVVRDRAATTLLRSTEYAPLSYHCQRSWIPTSVTVEIVDDTDPTPYWLISTRDPEAVAAAVRAARPTTAPA